MLADDTQDTFQLILAPILGLHDQLPVSQKTVLFDQMRSQISFHFCRDNPTSKTPDIATV